MAIHAHSTTVPAFQRGLLRPALTDATTVHDFSPAAIMARADGYAADQAGRAAARPAPSDTRTADDLLEGIRRTIEGQDAHPKTGACGLALTGVVPSHDTRFALGATNVRDVIAKPAGLSSERSCASSARAEALLSAPEPLPSLTTALSRRRALFGAVVLAAAPVAALPVQAAPALSANDRRLVALAEAYETLDRRCDEHAAAHRHDLTNEADAEFDIMTSGFGPLEEECAATPADSLAGIMAKARICRSPTARGCADNEHAFSIADDLCRLYVTGRIAHA